MTLRKSKADLYYQDIIKAENNKIELMTEFLRKEANCLVILSSLIDQCKDDNSYKFNFPLMKMAAAGIRTNKLLLIKNQFDPFDFYKNHYFNKFLSYLRIQ